MLDWCAARPIHFLVSTQFCSPFYYSAHRGHAFSLLLCATTQYAFLHMVEKIVEHRPTKKKPGKIKKLKQKAENHKNNAK